MAKDSEDTHKIYNQFDGMGQVIDLQKILDKAAQDQGIQFAGLNAEVFRRGAMSTGALALDLIMGGGHGPGRFTYFYGDTGTCKSTILFHSLKEAIASDTFSMFYDTESSVDAAYLSKIGLDMSQVLGLQNKQGKWEVRPKMQYSTPSTVEQISGHMHDIMKKLPDKIVMDDNGTPRFFVISPDFAYKPSWLYINKGLKEKKIVEVENYNPQMVFFVDSLKMGTQARDDDNSKETIAMLARSLSNFFSLIKSYLGKKNCSLIGTNHLTINPMARFQNPETEPGGKAVQFYPDIKIQLRLNRAAKRMITEPHVSGIGHDRYLVGTANIQKNKMGPSFRKMDYRIWVDEKGEPGRGLCPVFDMYQFLLNTKQLDVTEVLENRVKVTKLQITVPGHVQEPMIYDDFKRFVLTNDAFKDLKVACRKQLTEGIAQELYYESIKEEAAGVKKKGIDLTGGTSLEDDELKSDDEPMGVTEL